MTITLKPKELKPKELKQNGLSKLKANKWLLGLLILISMIGVGYLAYYQLIVVPQQQAKLKIQTALVKRGNLTIAVSANGTVEPERSVNVSPKTSGILKQLLVKEGDSVQLGQVLAYKDKGESVFMPIVVGTTVNDKTEVKSGLTGNEHVLLSFPPGTRKVSTANGRRS